LQDLRVKEYLFGGASGRCVFRLRDFCGRMRHVQMGVGRIRGTKRSVVSLTDITDLKEAFEEIGILLREIHHRVKNNLQIISSLLNLQVGRIGDGRVRRLLRESQMRIQAMAMIHEHLNPGHWQRSNSKNT